MTGGEPPIFSERIARIERALGRRVLTRPVRLPDRSVRGRIEDRATCILVEYRDSKAGYFWQYDILQELLELLEQGRLNVVSYEEDMKRASSPVRYALRVP